MAETIQLEVLDVHGKKVLAMNIEVNEGSKNAIDLRNLQPGMYLLKIAGRHFTSHEKLIILNQ